MLSCSMILSALCLCGELSKILLVTYNSAMILWNYLPFLGLKMLWDNLQKAALALSLFSICFDWKHHKLKPQIGDDDCLFDCYIVLINGNHLESYRHPFLLRKKMRAESKIIDREDSIYPQSNVTWKESTFAYIKREIIRQQSRVLVIT